MPRFVVVTGLPGSGKSTMGRVLAGALALPLLDKDEILESLFEESGVVDAAHRGELSRTANDLLQMRAMSLPGAVVVSWWRHPLSPDESGTPTRWLASLPSPWVEVHCRCRPETAVARFFARSRHPGHLDASRCQAEELARFRALEALGPIGLAPFVEIDTQATVDANRLILDIARL